ncbi:MAG: T9SS type A sorting domain-containing protein, partial [Flavobacteriales bacterium]
IDRKPPTNRAFSTQIQTRTYVLTMTDSTISSLCQRRIDTVLVEVKDCSVGVNEMSDIGIAIYPNPTRGFITIEAVIPLSRVWLTDLSGRKLQTLDQSGNLWKADLRTYSAGIYLIEAITKDGGHKIDKVIKSE